MGLDGASSQKVPSAKDRRQRRAARKAEADGTLLAEAEESCGSCTAQAVDWLIEAANPTLPVSSFNVVVVCDCLYENKDSWDALECILRRLLVSNMATEA